MTPKVIDTLLVLIEKHGEVVEKEDLISRVWPDQQAVEENNLTYNISVLRKALGEQKPERQFIVTLPGRGYRFIADVEDDPAAVSLNGGEEAAPAPAAPVLPQTEAGAAERGARRRPWRAAWLISLLVVPLMMWGVYYLLLADRGRRPFGPPKKITSTGRVWDAALSPDGQLVAYVLGDSDLQSLWVRQVDASREYEVVPAREVRFRGVTFSPDGKWIFYVALAKGETERVLYRIPMAGGTASKLISGVDSPITFSPDGKQLAYVSEDRTEGVSSLFLASVDGTGRRTLARRKSPAFFSIEGPSWSPDGKLVVSAAVDGAEVDFRALAVEVVSGIERPFGTKVWDWMKRVAWLPDSSGLLVLARERGPEKNNQLWHLSYPGGEAERITQDLNEYRGLSLTADGRRLALVATQTQSDIWVVPADDASRAAPIAVGGTDGRDGIDWTPDGRIVYTSEVGGEIDLQIIRAGDGASGGHPRRLNVADGAPHYPSISGDGRYAVFTSGRNGKPRVWRLELATNELRELTSGELDIHPVCSPDNRWVVYSSVRSGVRRLWRVALAGGEAVALTDGHAEYPAISPDGREVACLYQGARDRAAQVALIPIDGGAPKWLTSLPGSQLWLQVAWVPDGKALSYVITREGVSNIYQQPLAGGPARQLTDFKDQRIFAYAWSRDGRRLAVARGAVRGDVVIFDEAGK